MNPILEKEDTHLKERFAGLIIDEGKIYRKYHALKFKLKIIKVVATLELLALIGLYTFKHL